MNDNAQKLLEGGQKQNFFFDRVKEIFSNAIQKDRKSLENKLQIIKLRITLNESLNVDEVELIGAFAFIVGIDYTSQAYPQKKIIENVNARLTEVGIDDSLRELYKEIFRELKGKEHLITDVVETVKTSLTDSKQIEKLVGTSANFLGLKNELILPLLESIEVPIGISQTVVELHKDTIYTPEQILKFNSMLQEQANIPGDSISTLISLYEDKLFNTLLTESAEFFNKVKYFLIYEESIISLLESTNLFDLILDPKEFTDEEYQTAKEQFEKEQKIEKEQVGTVESNSTPNETPKKKTKEYSEEEFKDACKNRVDEIISIYLSEFHNKPTLDSVDDVIKAIDSLIDNPEQLQYLYMFMAQNINNQARVVGNTYISENINIAELVNILNSKIEQFGVEYKRLAEINCAELPEDVKTTVVELVDKCIHGCILSTKDQKTYLVSQILENGITTWNHLQQIISILETCTIKASYSNAYLELVEIFKEKEIFANAEMLTNLELKMSAYRAFREWYKFHLK